MLQSVGAAVCFSFREPSELFWPRCHKNDGGSNLLEQLQDGQDNIVDVAEARSLRLLCMVKSSSPVDGDVGLLSV